MSLNCVTVKKSFVAFLTLHAYIKHLMFSELCKKNKDRVSHFTSTGPACVFKVKENLRVAVPPFSM